jgi:hypothetical protein
MMIWQQKYLIQVNISPFCPSLHFRRLTCMRQVRISRRKFWDSSAYSFLENPCNLPKPQYFASCLPSHLGVRDSPLCLSSLPPKCTGRKKTFLPYGLDESIFLLLSKILKMLLFSVSFLVVCPYFRKNSGRCRCPTFFFARVDPVVCNDIKPG